MTVVIRRILVPAVLVPLLVVSGCGSAEKKAEKPKATVPTGNVEVPKELRSALTEPGTDLEFGEKAVVAYEPNDKRNTVLELTVTGARRGTIADLAAYTLDAQTRKSVPYYVDVTVTNVGRGDVGRTSIPLLAMYDEFLLQPSGFTNTFKPCPSRPLPASFAPADSTKACLVYLVPDGGELKGVSFRPSQKFAPIEWSGTITTPSPKPKPKPKAKKKP